MSRHRRCTGIWTAAGRMGCAAISVAIGLVGLAADVAAADPAAPSRRPNFVFILGEGHGWSSTSVAMDDNVPDSKSSFVRTPNLEKLARSGTRLACFYAPSPRCTPSRASFLTGKSPAQLHMTFVGEGQRDSGLRSNSRLIPPDASTELPTGETTIAELLRGAGYATAHFGKWHMGRADPGRHGFDLSDGPTSNGGPDNVENPHPKELYGMTQRGIEFISQQARAGTPFYLQLSHYASRGGGDALPETTAAVKRWGVDLSPQQIAEAAATLDLDIALGMVLKSLDDLGLTDNTYVIFTTDHGTPGRNPPLSGGKGTVSEGGLRVPFVIRGPGIKPGVCSRVRAVGEDLFPTIAELAHVAEPLPAGIEGGSLANVLAGADVGIVKRPREEFVVHFPHYDKDAIGPASAILLGDYKLVRVYEMGQLRLFNIAEDPGERRDLAAKMPEKVQELDRRLSEYLAAVNAQMPVLNARYDPSKGDSDSPPAAERGRRGKNRSRSR